MPMNFPESTTMCSMRRAEETIERSMAIDFYLSITAMYRPVMMFNYAT
jgi:hypothetical protein